jgi:hypothetical protein
MGNAFRFISARLARALLLLVGLLAVTAAVASAICDLEQATVEVDQEHCCASLDAAGPVAPALASASESLPTFSIVPVIRLPEWRETDRVADDVPPDRPSLSLPYHARSRRILN